MAAASYDTLAATTPILPGSKRSALFVRLRPEAALDVGERRRLQIRVLCIRPGDAKITCHVHADIDNGDLFPTSQNPSAEQTISVMRRGV
jgi:hypothetical protein